jgi:hypothetical protein
MPRSSPIRSCVDEIFGECMSECTEPKVPRVSEQDQPRIESLKKFTFIECGTVLRPIAQLVGASMNAGGR